MHIYLTRKNRNNNPTTTPEDGLQDANTIPIPCPICFCKDFTKVLIGDRLSWGENTVRYRCTYCSYILTFIGEKDDPRQRWWTYKS